MFHVIVAVLAGLGALWTLAIWLSGGFTVVLLGITIQSHDPFRPLALAAVGAAVYAVTSGPHQRTATHDAAGDSAGALPRRRRHRQEFVDGGWRRFLRVRLASRALAQGDLTVPIPLAATAPWPDPVWTFAPHGFRPAVSASAIVPVTAPGLPLLMAAAKALGGHCAMFLVTPLSGALLVWLTFAIGRVLGSEVLGLAAAWLVATSPAVLAMLVSPMSDVPAAAAWAAAIYFVLG